MRGIKEVMSKHLVGIAKSAKVNTALKLMESAKVTLLPVVQGKKLVGIVTKDVLLTTFLNKPVGSVMAKPVFVDENSSMHDAATVMIKKGIARLPIVNSKDEMLCVGIVTSTEIARDIEDGQ